MLSVIVLASDDAAAIETTLRGLVEGALAGTVLDVTVLRPEGSSAGETVERLCEAMGAELADAGRARDCAYAARADWLLLLQAGAAPVGDWQRVVATHIARGGGAARFRTREASSIWRWLFGRARDPLRSGFLAPKPIVMNALRTGPIATVPLGRAGKVLDAELKPASAS